MSRLGPLLLALAVGGCGPKNAEPSTPPPPVEDPDFVPEEIVAQAGGQANLEEWNEGTYVVEVGSEPRQLRYRIDQPVVLEAILYEEFSARIDAAGEWLELSLPIVEVPYQIQVQPISRGGAARVVATTGAPRVQLTQQTELGIAAIVQRELMGTEGARGSVTFDARGGETDRESEVQARIVHPVVRLYLRSMDTFLGTVDLPRSAVGVGGRFLRRLVDRDGPVTSSAEVRYEILSIEGSRVRIRFEFDATIQPTRASDEAFGPGAIANLQRGSLHIDGETVVDLHQVVLLDMKQRVNLIEEYAVEQGGRSFPMRFELAGGISVQPKR